MPYVVKFQNFNNTLALITSPDGKLNINLCLTMNFGYIEYFTYTVLKAEDRQIAVILRDFFLRFFCLHCNNVLTVLLKLDFIFFMLLKHLIL